MPAPAPELPRRLFRHLSTSGAEALPLLRVLYGASASAKARQQQQQWPDPDADSHDGYPLAHAVYAGAVPLVRFLLDHGSSPRRRNALSVRLAIKRRDLALVRMFVEPPPAARQEVGRSGSSRFGDAEIRSDVQRTRYCRVLDEREGLRARSESSLLALV